MPKVQVLPEVAFKGGGTFKKGTPPSGAAGACSAPLDAQEGQFLVSLEDDPISFAVRCHEYGHLGLEANGRLHTNQITPVSEASNNLIAQSIFDVLVNAQLQRNGLSEELKSLPWSKYCNLREIDFTTYLRTLDVSGKKQIAKILSREDKKLLRQIKNEIVELLDIPGLIPTERLVEIATRLKTEFGLPPEEKDTPKPEAPMGSDSESESDSETASGFGEITSEDDSIENGGSLIKSEVKKPKAPPKVKPIPKEIRDELEGKKPTFKVPKIKKVKEEIEYDSDKKIKLTGDPFDVGLANGEPGQWGQMFVDYHKLEKQVLNSEKRARKVRPGFVGALRYPLRALLPAFDGSAFGTKQRSKGGTLLIDWSGSMSISDKQIEELVRQAPHLTLAMYCGGRKDNEFQGTLVVLAARGRRVENLRATKTGGLNVVDGPALEWLSRQPSPRIWICDGRVTGVNDNGGPNFDKWALKLKKLGRITQYKSIDHFQKRKAVEPDRLL